MEKFRTLLATFLVLTIIENAILSNAEDPNILKDFLVPPSLNPENITRQYFTYTGFRPLRKANLTGKTTALVTKVTLKEFPALEGQGVSVSAIIYPPSGMNLPHLHPRASELLVVLLGTLEVGFVDTTNKLFMRTLQPSDMFIFPKGLIHFQVNTRFDSPAYALGVFGSANSGTVSLPGTIFGSGISPEILANGFNVDQETISKLIEANKK
ncbi:germin-like protein 9-3 [Euphorbia lathyris]|uniref:germin-like protein 9-3 n=1 Tax=Euphorbia lathyris TaxID=212925 RepID=UPI0033139198